MPDTPSRRPNRLQHESSPYLQQHARNPVDWFPWSDEALQRAREVDRPIFLSIGYSACHWCHVMEHESFENEDIAALMNRGFVNIKVDREERPDLDQIYMNAVIAIAGRGGWPMSVFLTPDLKPFYGGTYWPPESRMGMPGFRDVLQKVSAAWDDHRDRVLDGATELTDAVIRMGSPQGERGTPAEELLRNAMNVLLKTADRTHGGFGEAPKFPHPMDLRVLLRCWKRFDNGEALEIVRLSLDKMSHGGLYDQLGGGFHRYSTDARWLAPHFEKMLYDNALLVPVYLEAFQATGHAEYARVVRETLDYTLREMTSPQGGFYSTQDADSEGEEGKFFVWSESEIVEHLGPDDARIFNVNYDVSARGNWEGHNILNRVKTHADAAKSLGISEEELSAVLSRCKKKLLAARSQRIAPGRDDKILTSWNGLMMAAMSAAAQILGEDCYAHAARKAADFVLESLREKTGRLLHVWKDGNARLNAYLDDYACLIDGLVELYQAVSEVRYLEAAVELAELMQSRFADADGGFFFTSDDHEQLIARYKDVQDNATPSGNAMAATALLKLARITGRRDFEQLAVGTLEMLNGFLQQHPQAGGQALMAVDFLLGQTHELVIVDENNAANSVAAIHHTFLPNKVVVRRPPGIPDTGLPAMLQPLLAGKSAREGSLTAFLCEQGTCQEPVIGMQALRRAIATIGKTATTVTD